MSQSLSEVTYTPESRLRHPFRLIRTMFIDLWRSRELAWRLLVRDISAQYRQTLLGLFWAFLPPVATTGVFVMLNKGKVMNVGNLTIPYPAFVMLGTIFWQLFADALNTPLKTVTAAKSMLSKINFPQEALVLSGIGAVLFNFAIRLILLVPVFLWFRVSVAISAVLTPVAILFLLLFGTVIGVFLVPLGLLYQDFARGLTILTSFWMLLTPVVYPPPDKGILAIVTDFNPVAPLIVTAKGWVITGFGTVSSAFWVVGGITFGMLFVGWLLYKLSMPIVIERMKA